MASALPAKLKVADIPRFATRAAQLEKFRPVVAYWCEYHLLQQILSKQLHTLDDECSSYAVQLMDKLESFKTTNASNDAVVDDVAAQAYVENFALSTFNRADEMQRSNKVTRQTADTFQAAATFLDLLSVWGTLDPDIAAKSKFAKYHAVRIAKAIKAGEDPNATNPAMEEPAEPAAPAVDELEDELAALGRQQPGPSTGGEVYRPPTVESTLDSGMPSRPESARPDPAEPPPPPEEASGLSAPPDRELDISPAFVPAEEPATGRLGSTGGGYFPTMPSEAQPTDVNMSEPLAFTPQPPLSQPQAPAAGLHSPFSPQDYYNTAAPAPPSPIASPDRPHRPTPSQMDAQPPTAPPLQSALPVPISTGYRTDDEATMAAQKHAKWAISALNFEDVPTAVKELRSALQSLGAT